MNQGSLLQQVSLRIIGILWVIGISFSGFAQIPDKPVKEFFPGGQFKDLVLPMPIYQQLENKNIWGAENVIPRDIHNGIEDNKWSYWGGNPILGKDGKYHIAVCRWKEEAGHWGWPDSEVAHCVSEHPTGPYYVTGTLIEKGHNPEIIKLEDGTYCLHISGGNIYTSQQIAGPWSLIGKITIDERGHKGLSHLFTNLTGVFRKDGSILFFSKRGDVMVSNTGLLGPYRIVSAHNYSRYSGYPEDPVIWKSRYYYNVIYNHAVDQKSVYMRSLDGIHWITEPGLPYDSTIFHYTDGTKNRWYKYERPKVLQDEYGRATHLSLAVIDVKKRDDLGNDAHSSKHVIMPLVTEKLLKIMNTEPVGGDTEKITLRIKAEPGFDPVKQVNVSSLRFGIADKVNYGIGLKPIDSNPAGKDLIVIFGSEGHGISGKNFDLKLLGQTKSGEIITGYALLPGKTEDPPSLVILPVFVREDDHKKMLVTAVENVGLQKSELVRLKVLEYTEEGRITLKEFEIPALKPYEEMKIEVPLQNSETLNRQFEAVIIDSKKKTTFWKKVDDRHHSINYSGEWKKHREAGKNIFMGSEQQSNQKGAKATFFFTGSQARCFGCVSKEMGGVDVFVDGSFIERIDGYFSNEIHNTVIYQTEVLPEGSHTLELRATGENYKGGDSSILTIDAFSYRNLDK